MQQQVEEHTSFLHHVLTRFETALAAVNAMENHCLEMDARTGAMQRECEARIAALQEQHETAMRMVQDKHNHALKALQQQHETAMQEAHTR